MKVEPIVDEQINGYLIKWSEPYNLTARVSRLRIPSDGQVRGELEIKHNKNGNLDYLLVPTQFNFSSEPTRVKFAKQLSDKLDLEIEWKEIFDYLCQQIPELARAGDDAIEVFPDPNSPPPEQLLQGLIYKGVQNIIFGEKGVCKSTLAYFLGMCVTLPWKDNPLDLSVPKESIRTLVLDWETDKNSFLYCMSRLQKGMDIPICSLFYRRCALPLIDDIEAIQKKVEEIKAKGDADDKEKEILLVIDSLGAAAGGERGELKGSEAALLFNAALRKLKLTSLIIGQTSKGDADGKRKMIFGSTYFTYYARNIFELCTGHDDYGDSQHLALFHRECNLGKKMSPIGLRIEFNDTDRSINIEREAVSIAEFSQKVSVGMRILEVLKEGAMNSKELVDYLEVSRNAVDQALKRLRTNHKITDTGGKKWGLPVI